MSNDAASDTSMMDGLKWSIVFFLFIGGIAANYYYNSLPVPLRVMGGIALVGAMLGVASLTAKGKQAWSFVKDARVELRKVVWPTRQETVQKTVLVVVAVLVVGLILWGIDSILLWLIGLLTS